MPNTFIDHDNIVKHVLANPSCGHCHHGLVNHAGGPVLAHLGTIYTLCHCVIPPDPVDFNELGVGD